MITLEKRDRVQDGDGFASSRVRGRYAREGTAAQREAFPTDKLRDGDTWLDWDGDQNLWFWDDENKEWVTKNAI